MDLSQVVGGNPMLERAKEYKLYGLAGVGIILAVSTIIGCIIWLCKKPDRWYDENPKEKLFVIEVVDNHRAVTIEQIKEEYGIDEQRANWLVQKYGGKK